MKRTISFFLVITLLLFSLPMSVFAREDNNLASNSEGGNSLSLTEAQKSAEIKAAETKNEPEEITYESLAYKPKLTDKEKAQVEEELIAKNQQTEIEAGIIPSEPESFDVQGSALSSYAAVLTSETGEDLPAGPETAPELLYRTQNEIQMKSIDGLEYSIDGGAHWIASGLFTNILEQEEYTVISRYAKSETSPASSWSPALIVSVKMKPKPPARPIASMIDRTTVTIKPVDEKPSIQYSIDGGKTWQTNGFFKDLEPGATYSIIAQFFETDSQLASEVSEPLVISTVPADTYLVSTEQELLEVLSEISTLQATKPRVNVRFENDITVSDTVVLPRLKGRMALYLDLYGFTLTCTKKDAAVVEINTRATLGSSYYLDSGISSEKIRGGRIVATGKGNGIVIGAGAVTTLNGLTFDCDLAIQNSGEIETLEHIQGRIKNDGYISRISGISLTAADMDEWEIYNEGTIDTISNCTFSGGLNDDVVWHGFFDESRVGFIHNLGYIGRIQNTDMRTERPIVLFNGKDAEIGTIADSQWCNYNYNRGSLCLNYGVIDTIESGSYYGWSNCFLNHGTINHILGGWFDTDHDFFFNSTHNRTKEENEYLKTVNDVYSCFGNWGTIKDVAGGIYYGGYSLYGRGYWYRDGKENIGRTWVDWKAFSPQSDDAVFKYREGYGMSRSLHKTDNGGEGFKIDKLYKVQYDNSETNWYLAGNSYSGAGFYYDDPIVKGTYKGYQNGKKVDIPVYSSEEMPDWLYYCEGDTIYTGDLLSRHHGWIGTDYISHLRNVQGKHLDNDGILSKETDQEYYAVDQYHRMYEPDGYEVSDPEIMSTYKFKMPAKDITFTPKYRYAQPAWPFFRNDTRYSSYADKYCNSVMVKSIDFEQVIHPGDYTDWKYSNEGFSWGIILHGLDDFLAFPSSVSPVSGWEIYQGDSRPFHYEWSLDKVRWYRDGEEAAIDAQVCAAYEDEKGEKLSSAAGPFSVWIKSVANDGTYDQSSGIAEMRPCKMVELILDGGSAAKIPNGSTIAASDDGRSVILNAGLGTAEEVTNAGMEVQVALENPDGNVTPFDFTTQDFRLSGSKDPSGSINKYHPDILRCQSENVTINNVTPGTKVKARWRQYVNGYIVSERMSAKQPNMYSGNYAWYFEPQTLWSDWQEAVIKSEVDAPGDPPVLISRTDTVIVIESEPDQEYSIDGGKTWQTIGEFSGLNPGTQYEVISRYPETATSSASSCSPALTVSTRDSEDILSSPLLVSYTDTTITVEIKPGLEYSIDGGETWQTAGEFTGLKSGTEYQIISRHPEEKGYVSPPLLVKTIFPAPVLASRTATSITLEVQDALEYSIDYGQTWQTSETFSELEPGTEYQIICRRPTEPDNYSEPLKANTKTVHGAPSSPPVLISKSDSQIIVETEPDMEYSINDGQTWQGNGTFEGLDSGKEYEIISRFTETEDASASEAGLGLSITTKTYPHTEIVPPTIASITADTITVEVVPGQEYSLRLLASSASIRGWTNTGIFSGLQSDTEYEVLTRIEETEETVASEIGTETAVALTDKQPIVPDPERHEAYILGYPDGTVRPQTSITRAEAAVIFFRTFPQETVLDLAFPVFPDVKPNTWYYEQVQQLAAAGLLLGDGNGFFHPENAITRAEFATLAVRIASDLPSISASSFTDISGSWAEANILQAASMGWIGGYEDGTFRPNDPITRAEAMAIVNRMLNRNPIISSEALASLPLWPDCDDPDEWYFYDILEASMAHDYVYQEDGTELWR